MEIFLRRNLEWLHGRCDPIWLDAALASFETERALILSDAAVRYPQIDTGSSFGPELNTAVETDAALLGTVLYRIEHGIFRRNPENDTLRYLAHLMRFRCQMEIYYSTVIGPRLRIEHGMGIVVGPRNTIGSDFVIHQGVTLGQRRLFAGNESITMGNRCQIFAGAKILGAVRVGDDVKIGANAVLLTDAETGGTYVGAPAKRK